MPDCFFFFFNTFSRVQLRRYMVIHVKGLRGCKVCQKCPFSSAKNGTSSGPILRTDSKNLANHPPKWFTRHLVHAFSIFGRVSSQFLKITFLEAIWRRFTLLKGQKLETGGQARKMPQKSFSLQKWVEYI